MLAILIMPTIFRLIIGLSIATLLNGCTNASKNPERMVFQIRHSKSMAVHTNTHFDFVQGADSARHAMWSGMVKKTEDAEYVIYELRHFYYPARKRALYVGPHDWSSPPQVFILSALKYPFNSDWNVWRGPDFMDTSRYPSWDYQRGAKVAFSTNIPVQHFEMRYKFDFAR